ncbi:hypothetical protein HPB50_007322 [Hyalomma asiaticum]|uniref:Uncharacterized protein n=1 Tax=Hyalomma asiaticum TaxID=266040 RepID=A0ACB7SW69_HYAAI|nr:hypothetical protein HPB50_007322 [Hyalomma asiaticum]
MQAVVRLEPGLFFGVQYSTRRAFRVSVVDGKGQLVARASVCTDQVTVAEEIAIALALVYSDSRSAVLAFSGGLVSQQAARLLRSGRRQARYGPGIDGVNPNASAHTLARECTNRAGGGEASGGNIDLRKDPLTTFHEITSSYKLSSTEPMEGVTFRLLQTNTYLCPRTYRRIAPDFPEECARRGLESCSLTHMLWQCPANPRQLQDMSAVIVPKRSWRRKRKSKLSSTFGSATSGHSQLPSGTETMSARLLALVAIPQKSNEDERKRATGGGGDSMQVAAVQFHLNADVSPTAQTLPNGKRKSELMSPSISHFKGNNCKISSSKPAFIGDEAIVCNKPEATPLTHSDVEDIASHPREVLRENGPCQEVHLLEVLSISQAQMIINFTPNGEGDALDECAAVSLTPRSNEGGFQHSLAGGDGGRRAGAIYSGSASNASAVDEGRDKQEKCRLKHSWSQVDWLPRYHSRALQALQQSCEADVQKKPCYSARLAEIEPTLKKREKRIVELDDGIISVLGTRARVTLILRDEQLKAAAALSARKAPDARKNEQQPCGRNMARESSLSPWSRLPRRERAPPRRPRVKKLWLLFCEKTAPLRPLMRRETQAPLSKGEKPRVLASEPKTGPSSPRRKAEVKPHTLPSEQVALLGPTMCGGAPSTLRKAKEKQRARCLAPKALRLSSIPLRTMSLRRRARKNSSGQPFEHTAELGLPMPGPKVEQKRRARALGRKTDLLSPLRRRAPSPRRNTEGSSRVLPVRQAAWLTPRNTLIKTITSAQVRGAPCAPPEDQRHRGVVRQNFNEKLPPAKSKAEEQMKRL